MQTENQTESMVAALVAELDQEAQTTRRLLDSVPETRYSWRPHEKGRSMGELCAHIATVPTVMSAILGGESFDVAQAPSSENPPDSREATLAMHDQGVQQARAWLNGIGDGLFGSWSLVRGEEEIMSMPRVAAIRGLLFNHLYHHRGQLSAYLRAAGERVPSVYGPSADEDPFALA